jgi:hypothetical protein
MKRSCCLLFALVLPLSAAAADCAVVFGQGRSPPSADTQINDRWNRLNFSFHDAFQEQLSDGGLKVVPVFLTVQSADAASNTEQVRRAAADAGCSKLLSISVYSENATSIEELVFAVSATPIREGKRVEPAQYKKEYRFPATSASFQQVVPSRLAAQAVRELPDQWKR